MKLDFRPATGAFTLEVPRANPDLIQSLVREHGLDLSTTAGDGKCALCFTREPYAAATFAEFATERARAQLGPMLVQIEASRALTAGGTFACPPDKEFWDFQKADLAYALARKNTLIGDQPGLGKTEVGIGFANEIKAHNVLAIVPANIRGQWSRRLVEWSTMLPFGAYNNVITHGKHGVHPTKDHIGWNIVSYDLARTEAIGKALAREHYDLLILDEAHYLKTVDTRRTRAVFGGGEKPLFENIAGRAERILGLTGTPLPNRPREAYTLARGLCWDAIDWQSEAKFRERFNPSMMREGERADGSFYQYVDERSGRHAELQNRLRANFMVRHLKREVMPQLKMPVYDIISLEATMAVKAALRAESLLDIDPEMFEHSDAEIFGHISVVRHQMGLAIAPQVADYVKMLLDGGEEKIVLFYWHVDVGDILYAALEKHGILRIDGTTSAKRRDAAVAQFQSDPRKNVMLGNLQSMGIGVDGLQKVSCHGLIAEPSWTPGENVQAFDRLDRGGQQRAVQGDIFVAPGSLAEKILTKALHKLRVTDSALDKMFT